MSQFLIIIILSANGFRPLLKLCQWRTGSISRFKGRRREMQMQFQDGALLLVAQKGQKPTDYSIGNAMRHV